MVVLYVWWWYTMYLYGTEVQSFYVLIVGTEKGSRSTSLIRPHLPHTHSHLPPSPSLLTLMKEFCSTSSWLSMSVVRSMLTGLTASSMRTCGSLVETLDRTSPLSFAVGSDRLRSDTCGEWRVESVECVGWRVCRVESGGWRV